MRASPQRQEQVLRYAQDFGSRLKRLLNASSLERSERNKWMHKGEPGSAASPLR
jgi:hypothetical protein